MKHTNIFLLACLIIACLFTILSIAFTLYSMYLRQIFNNKQILYLISQILSLIALFSAIYYGYNKNYNLAIISMFLYFIAYIVGNVIISTISTNKINILIAKYTAIVCTIFLIIMMIFYSKTI